MSFPKKIGLISAIMIFLCLPASPGRAEKAYITESFKVSLRAGPGYEKEVVASPSSGTPVEIVTQKDDWVLVRFQESGGQKKEGWILKRYLMDRKPLQAQVVLLESENAGLKNDVIQIEKDLQASIQKNRQIENVVKERTESLDRLKKNFKELREGVYSYPRLKMIHKITQSKVERIQKDIRSLVEENKKMRDSQNDRWLITGALILLCGLLMGSIFGRQHRKRPYY